MIVVGAGIFGASIAFRLTERGAGRVVLVDGRWPAAGMSGRTFGQVRRHYSNELTIRLANRGFEALEHWADEVGRGAPGYVRLGYLLLVPEEDAAACRANIELAQRCGVATRFLSSKEIPDVEPLVSLEGIAGGAFEPDGGIVDVVAMIQGWIAAGLDRGLECRFGSPVSAIDVADGRVRGVRTKDGEVIVAPVVVNAAGCWGRDLVEPLGLDLPIAFHRLQMGYLRQPAGVGTLRTAVTVASDQLVMRPDRGPVSLIAAYESRPVEPSASFADDISPEFERSLRSRVVQRVPAYSEAQLEWGVSGLYDVTPDWHPILGWAPGVDGLYLAVGWSGHGLKLSPPVGEIVADEVLGRQPFLDVSPLRLERFERGELMKLAYGPGARA